MRLAWLTLLGTSRLVGTPPEPRRSKQQSRATQSMASIPEAIYCSAPEIRCGSASRACIGSISVRCMQSLGLSISQVQAQHCHTGFSFAGFPLKHLGQMRQHLRQPRGGAATQIQSVRLCLRSLLKQALWPCLHSSPPPTMHAQEGFRHQTRLTQCPLPGIPSADALHFCMQAISVECILQDRRMCCVSSIWQ